MNDRNKFREIAGLHISENFKCGFRKTLIPLYIVTNLSSKSHVNFEGGQSACKRFRSRGVWQSCKKVANMWCWSD